MSEINNELTLSNKERLGYKSIFELKRIQVMCFCGLMGAFSVVVGRFGTFMVLNYLRVGFTYVPNQIVSFLFGPWIGGIFGAVMDIVNCIVNPKGPYFPGYTITAVTASVIYALWLYKRPVKLWRVIAAEVTVKIVCFMGLNVLWGVMTTGNAWPVVAAGKLALNLAKLPADVAIMMVLLPICNKVIKPALSINLKSIRKHQKAAE